jgi:hypothetical protein
MAGLGDFGKTTVQPAGIRSASQGDVSSGTEALARGIQSFQNPLTQLAAIENDKRHAKAKADGQRDGTLAGLEMDDQGNLVPPDLGGVDTNTTFGKNYVAAAEASYFGSLQTQASTGASLLAAKANGNSAVYEELAQAEIDAKLDNIPDGLAPKAEAILRTSYSAKRAAVLVEEQKRASAGQVEALNGAIATANGETRTLAIQGDATGAFESQQRAVSYLDAMRDAGHINEAQHTKGVRELEDNLIFYGLESGLLGIMNDPNRSEGQQIADGMAAISELSKMTPDELGVADQDRVDAIRDRLFTVVQSENSRRVQQRTVRQQGKNQLQEANARAYAKQAAAGIPVDIAQATRDLDSGAISIQTYTTVVAGNAKLVEKGRKAEADKLAFDVKNKIVSFQEVVTDPARWGMLNPGERLKIRQEAIDQATAAAEAGFEAANAEVVMGLSMHPADYTEWLKAQGVGGDDLLARSDKYLKRFYDPNNPAVIQANLHSKLNKGVMPDPRSKEEQALYQQHQQQLDIYSGDFDPEMVGGMAGKGFVFSQMGDQIKAALKTRNPQNVSAAMKAFSAICSSTSQEANDAGCVSLKAQIGSKTYNTLEELTATVTPEEPDLTTVLLETEKRVDASASDLSSTDRKVAAEGGFVAVDQAANSALDKMFENVLKEAAPGILSDIAQAGGSAFLIRHFIQMDDPELRAAVRANPAILDDLNSPMFRGLIKERLSVLISQEPKGRELDEARMQQLTQQATIGVMNENDVVVRNTVQHPIRSDGTIDVGEREERPELFVTRNGAASQLNALGAPFVWTDNMTQGETMLHLREAGFTDVPRDASGKNLTAAEDIGQLTYDLEPVRGRPGVFRVHYLNKQGTYVPYMVKNADGISGVATVDYSNPLTLFHTQMYQQAQEDPTLWAQFGGSIPIFGDAIRQGSVEARMEEARPEAARAQAFFTEAGVPHEAQMIILPPIGRAAFGLPQESSGF